MFPAYTKYEFINRLVVPGFLFTGASAYLIAPGLSIDKLLIISALGTFPAGYFIDILRDWIGYGFEFLSKKISFFKIVFPFLRRKFTDYFFYLEKTYKLPKTEALKINFKFFFWMNTEQRYYFSVRQSWASFTTNIFISLLVLNILNLCLIFITNRFSMSLTVALFLFLLFFYYAGVYRLISVEKLYNVLLDEFYNKVYLKGEVK